MYLLYEHLTVLIIASDKIIIMVTKQGSTRLEIDDDLVTLLQLGFD